jgi:glutamate 5-kinase
MKYKKIVVKIGTSVLAKKDGTIDRTVIEGLSSQVCRLLEKGIKVIIVSSGAIASGAAVLKLKHLPGSLSDLQATASIGQSELMRLYSDAFKKNNFRVGQILLTQDDFDERPRYLNIKYTLNALIAKRVVPIVNENDTVSTEEIKCGDNDRLSGLVADLAEADLLIMLTDVDGFRGKDGKIISEIREISDDIIKLAGSKCSLFTKGGMATKIEAARRAVNSGIDCFIANGRKDNIISEVLEGRGPFTYFSAKPVKTGAKKRWIAYSSKLKGRILVDDGAKKALLAHHRSLLSSGITGKEGNFKAGDVVGISDSKGKEFARGLTNYSSKELVRIKGLKTGEIEAALGYKDHDEVIHKDNLAIL